MPTRSKNVPKPRVPRADDGPPPVPGTHAKRLKAGPSAFAPVPVTNHPWISQETRAIAMNQALRGVLCPWCTWSYGKFRKLLDCEHSPERMKATSEAFQNDVDTARQQLEDYRMLQDIVKRMG